MTLTAENGSVNLILLSVTRRPASHPLSPVIYTFSLFTANSGIPLSLPLCQTFFKSLLWHLLLHRLYLSLSHIWPNQPRPKPHQPLKPPSLCLCRWTLKECLSCPLQPCRSCSWRCSRGVPAAASSTWTQWMWSTSGWSPPGCSVSTSTNLCCPRYSRFPLVFTAARSDKEGFAVSWAKNRFAVTKGYQSQQVLICTSESHPSLSVCDLQWPPGQLSRSNPSYQKVSYFSDSWTQKMYQMFKLKNW